MPRYLSPTEGTLLSLRMAHVMFALGAFGLTGAGGMYGYHLNQVRQRRAEIQAEEDTVRRRIREYEVKLAEAERVFNSSKRRATESRDAAVSLWEDRSERYGVVVKEREALIQVAPEGVGILQGIGEHFMFMTKILPTFHRFDAQAQRMNSLLVAVKAGESSGIGTVAPALRSTFEDDPFVRTVADNVIACAKTSDVPSDIHDLSASFTFCLDQLNEAFETAHARLVSSRATSVEATSPNLAAHAVKSFLDSLRANTEHQADVSPVELAQLEGIRREKQSLNCPSDIRSALAYADELSRKYTNVEVLAKEAQIIKGRVAKEKGSVAQTSPILEAASFEEAARRNDITFDPQVVVAMKQLGTWRSTAVAFLLQQQSLTALKAYSTCLSDTLTEVHEDLPERLMSTPQP